MTHAGAYLLNADTELVSAADLDANALASFGEKWAVPKTYADPLVMLDAEPIDILSICTPTITHSEIFEAALSAGTKTIFLEKPISQDPHEARRMVDLARHRQVAVNYYRRWNREIRSLRDDIRSGDWGEPISACVRYTKGLWVNGSHFVDLFRWFFGEPEAVRTLRHHDGPAPDDRGVDFSLSFSNGLTVDFHHLPGAEYVFLDVEIYFRAGRVAMRQRGQFIETDVAMREPQFGDFNILGHQGRRETAWKSCLTTAISELVAQRRDGGNPACGMMDGCRVVELCTEIAA